MQDLHNHIKVVNALNLAAISTNTTTSGVIIDLKGFESCEFVLRSGTTTDGDYLPLIQHGDDSGLSDAAAVPDGQLLGLESPGFADDTDDNKLYKIGYTGTKRYVRMQVVSTNVTTGGTFCGIAILGHPRESPQSTQET